MMTDRRSLCLVDDVITKGATLLAAATRLQETYQSAKVTAFDIVDETKRAHADADYGRARGHPDTRDVTAKAEFYRPHLPFFVSAREKYVADTGLRRDHSGTHR